jgi:hypothetical protein
LDIILSQQKNEKLFTFYLTRGSPQDIQKVRFFILNDPKKHMYDPGSQQLVCNRMDVNGKTPLYVACREGNLELVRTLVECEADPFVNSVVSIVSFIYSGFMFGGIFVVFFHFLGFFVLFYVWIFAFIAFFHF